MLGMKGFKKLLFSEDGFLINKLDKLINFQSVDCEIAENFSLNKIVCEKFIILFTFGLFVF